MPPGYISLAEARAAQAGELDATVARLERAIGEARARGAFTGAGPIFVGIGASHAAAAGAVWSLRARGIDAARLNAGEQPVPLPASTHPIVGVSQSGKSAETLAALLSVPSERRFCVVNARHSPMAKAASLNVSLGGVADSYASTIGYTATVAALGLMAEIWDDGRIDPAWSQIGAAVRALETDLARDVGKLVAHIGSAAYADVVGEAPSLGSAEVGSLLLREVARLPATGASTRQYLHGAMESAGGGAHILFGGNREAELARTLARAGHATVLVSAQIVVEESRLAVVRLPDVPVGQRPVLEAIVLQTLAVQLAEARGFDPDAFVFEHHDTKVA